MGKKSKRKKSSTSSIQQQHQQKITGAKKNDKPTLLEEETLDNLHFEDPFEDEFEQEDFVQDDDNNEGGGAEDMTIGDDDDGSAEKVLSWNPLTSTLDPGAKLEVDETAYKMHHSLTPEWPALSFDIIRDSLGESRTRFPHSMIAVAGSQADRSDRNRLTVMKLSDLCRTGKKQKSEKQIEDEILGEEYDKEDESDDDDSDDDVEEIEDMDPILEHFSLKHNGGVNRVRAMPQRQSIVATWSDAGTVNLYNIRGILDSFDRSSGVGSTDASGSSRKISRDPFFIYQGHSCEGWAMDWSRVSEGHLATGDCDGNIHLWKPSEGGLSTFSNSSFNVTNTYSPSGDNIDTPSVEDIQWSPTEGTVFATAECGGFVKIYDTRASQPMLTKKIHDNNADVNVISWNPIVSNLLATGGDDGMFSVWDLRNFQSTDAPAQPLARFTCHKNPITSLEWHPSDESMIVISDEDATYIYDLSIEEDEEEEDGETGESELQDGVIPPQLLFVHCGSQSTKEAHWHPQITSLVMTTALSGYSAFIPSNL